MNSILFNIFMKYWIRHAQTLGFKMLAWTRKRLEDKYFFLIVVLLFLKLVGKMIDLFPYIPCSPKFKNLLEYHISLNFNCTYFDNMENSNGVCLYLFLRINLEGAENPSFCSLYTSESAGRNKICRVSEVISLKNLSFNTVNLMICFMHQ